MKNQKEKPFNLSTLSRYLTNKSRTQRVTRRLFGPEWDIIHRKGPGSTEDRIIIRNCHTKRTLGEGATFSEALEDAIYQHEVYLSDTDKELLSRKLKEINREAALKTFTVPK